LSDIKNNSICENVANNFKTKKMVNIFEKIPDISDQCPYRILVLLEMDVQFDCIYSSNENKLALESIDNNELACGEKMTKTTINNYLLDYKDNYQILK
jgi:hypothetical protein